jgi:membrane associated rhomboid family serine protease
MSRMTVGVKWLLISNCVLFVAYFIAAGMGGAQYFLPFALVPRSVLGSLALWQLFTYLFLHSPYGFGHILVNMLTLWMFGTALESTWGTRRFLQYYFFCGVGAGVCVVALNALTGTMNTRTIGASGAIYGLLLAFGILFPRAVIYFFGLFPIEARWYVLIMGAIVFLSALGDTGGGVSHFAHLGGMAFGYAWLRFGLGTRRSASRGPKGPGLLESIEGAYRDWKLQRAKKKFQVYLRKHGTGSGYPRPGDKDDWVQ